MDINGNSQKIRFFIGIPLFGRRRFCINVPKSKLFIFELKVRCQLQCTKKKDGTLSILFSIQSLQENGQTY